MIGYVGIVNQSPQDFRSLVISKRFGLADVFIPAEKSTPVTLFLCGTGLDPEKPRFSDARMQVQSTLKWRWNVEVTLGEDLTYGLSEEFFDALSAEVEHFKKTDATVIVLGSPGTMVELGAFAAESTAYPKVYVLANEHYQKQKSFINVGPLAKIRKNVRFIPFEPHLVSPDFVDAIDEVVAQCWFDRSREKVLQTHSESKVSFRTGEHASAILAVIAATYPSGKIAIKKLMKGWMKERSIDDAIEELLNGKWIRQYNGLLIPDPGRLEELLPPGLIASCSLGRLRFLGHQLSEESFSMKVRAKI